MFPDLFKIKINAKVYVNIIYPEIDFPFEHKLEYSNLCEYFDFTKEKLIKIPEIEINKYKDLIYQKMWVDKGIKVEIKNIKLID